MDLEKNVEHSQFNGVQDNQVDSQLLFWRGTAKPETKPALFLS